MARLVFFFAVHSLRAFGMFFNIISKIKRNPSFTVRTSRLCYFLRLWQNIKIFKLALYKLNLVNRLVKKNRDFIFQSVLADGKIVSSFRRIDEIVL